MCGTNNLKKCDNNNNNATHVHRTKFYYFLGKPVAYTRIILKEFIIFCLNCRRLNNFEFEEQKQYTKKVV